MRFKAETVREEFESGMMKTDLKVMAFAIDGYVQHTYGLEIEWTDVWYKKGQFNSKTATHEEWRAIDGVIRHATKEINQDVADWINENFKLPVEGMEPCIFHDAGTGNHFHIQVSTFDAIVIPRLNKES